jgi:hypothetical protein
MDEVAHTQSNDGMLKNAARMDDEGVVEVRAGESSVLAQGTDEEETRARRRPWNRKRKSYSHAHFKVYKRRWFGLAQLVLLNVVVSWDVSYLIFASIISRGTACQRKSRYRRYRRARAGRCDQGPAHSMITSRNTAFLTSTPVAHLRPGIHLLSTLLQCL